MAARFHIYSDKVNIWAYLYDKNSNPRVGCLVELTDDKDNEIDQVTTDEKGFYEFNVPLENFPYGQLKIKEYGSGEKQKFEPLGDWETMNIPSGVVTGDEVLVQ